MSETWPDAIDTEEYDDIGEGIYDSEDAEADNEELRRGVEVGSSPARAAAADGRRTEQEPADAAALTSDWPSSGSERIAPRQGQAPAASRPRQATAPVRSLDLETSVRLDALRRAVEIKPAGQSRHLGRRGRHRHGPRPGFVLRECDQPVCGGARFAPLLLLSPAKKRSGAEGLLTDPRLIGAASILGIALLHGFTGSAHTVTIDDLPSDELGMNGTFDATAKDRLGNALSNAKFEWNSDKPWCLDFLNKSKGAFTLGLGQFTKEPVKITVTAGGVSTSTNVFVTKQATTAGTKTAAPTSGDALRAAFTEPLAEALTALTRLVNAVAADVAGENAGFPPECGGSGRRREECGFPPRGRTERRPS